MVQNEYAFSHPSIQYSTGSSSKVRHEKETQRVLIWKKMKLHLFIDEMILYIENPRFTLKLLELIKV